MQPSSKLADFNIVCDFKKQKIPSQKYFIPLNLILSFNIKIFHHFYLSFFFVSSSLPFFYLCMSLLGFVFTICVRIFCCILIDIFFAIQFFMLISSLSCIIILYIKKFTIVTFDSDFKKPFY